MFPSAAVFFGAAAAEITGSFAFWAWFRLGKSALWLAPGMASLGLFAFLLTQIETPFAGRAFAAYGGVYIFSSLVWLWLIEGQRPDGWDITGGVLSLAGAAIMLWGPRTT